MFVGIQKLAGAELDEKQENQNLKIAHTGKERKEKNHPKIRKLQN